MTPDELKAIEERAVKATPGPWTVVQDEYHGGHSIEAIKAYHEGCVGAVDLVHQEDAKFIAHAREDIPALISEVKRLREALEFYSSLTHHPADLESNGDTLVEFGTCAKKALEGK